MVSELFHQIDAILFYDWDPIGVSKVNYPALKDRACKSPC